MCLMYSIRPACTLRPDDPRASKQLSCSCLFKKFVRGPDCREGAKGSARHFARNPTPAHAHFAELGLAPRPEGKEPSRLKASSPFGVGADAITGDILWLSVGCLSPGLLSRDYFCCC